MAHNLLFTSRGQGGAALDYHDNKLFSQRLRSEMNRVGLDASTLAKELGFSKASVSNWLNQKHGAQSYTLERLANYFGVSPAWLAGTINDRAISSASLQHISDDPTHTVVSSAPCSGEHLPPVFKEHTSQGPAVKEPLLQPQFNPWRAANPPAITEGDLMVINTYLNASADSKEAIQSFVLSLLKHR